MARAQRSERAGQVRELRRVEARVRHVPPVSRTLPPPFGRMREPRGARGTEVPVCSVAG
ncbi:hypothetical protein [Streptomyces iconiensis]|uniref:Uncharacterized protein n=1 Tax=Streptomyces iconiensis TaxID=1384038 RepID=A0ABT6ZY44_9ACTN|nr:hypothetical protein [Streptomyces iconiensis]MDJ1133556.1 hypothetical protein [Streptomyces iconiensis]